MVKMKNLLIAFALLLAACAPNTKIIKDAAFTPPPKEGVVYVVPFATALVPDFFQKLVFDEVVDYLNAYRTEAGVSWFFIIKQDLKEVDPAWLSSQHYVAGEIWSYREESGCCNTELSVHARADIFQPNKKEPSVVVSVPLETFFDHDNSSLEEERKLLANRLARELGTRIIASLSKHP